MYVADTHAWLWHLSTDDRLGSDARQVFQNADKGEETVLLPTIVVVESVYTARKRGYDLEVQEVVADLTVSSNYHVRPMDSRILTAFTEDGRDLSIHDKIIVLTAEQDDATILTKDSDIQEHADAETVW